MKKSREKTKGKILVVKTQDLSLLTRIKDGVILKKNDYIKLILPVGRAALTMYATVLVPPYEVDKKMLKVEVKETDPVDDSLVKEKFLL